MNKFTQKQKQAVAILGFAVSILLTASSASALTLMATISAFCK